MVIYKKMNFFLDCVEGNLIIILVSNCKPSHGHRLITLQGYKNVFHPYKKISKGYIC